MAREKTLRMIRKNGEDVLVIPEKFFKCPDCSGGYEARSKRGGIISEDDRDDLDEDEFYTDECLMCSRENKEGYRCNWSGTPLEIYKKAGGVVSKTKKPKTRKREPDDSLVNVTVGIAPRDLQALNHIFDRAIQPDELEEWVQGIVDQTVRGLLLMRKQ